MRTEIVATLRVQIAALERGTGAGSLSPRLPFGIPELDAHLPGQGLALGAVHELFAGGPAAEQGAAPALFAAAMLARRAGPVLWIAARGDLYPPALVRAGPRRPRSRPHGLRRGATWRPPGHGGEPAPSRPGRRGVRARGAPRPRGLTAAAAGRRGHGGARLRPAPVAAVRRSGAADALGFVVETLGFDTVEYRAKKARLKQILTGKPGCYLEHVARGGAAQAGNDVRFREDLLAFGRLAMQADKRETA